MMVILPLYSREIPPGLLRPALEPSAQERHGPVGVGPEEATEMNRGLENFSYEERLRELGISAWRREGCEKTILRHFSSQRGLRRKMGTNFLAGPVAIGQGAMALK